MAAQNRVLTATYRAFLREARRLQQTSTPLALVLPIDLGQWGSGRMVEADNSAKRTRFAQKLNFPGVDFSIVGEKALLSGDDVRAVVRSAFRQPGGCVIPAPKAQKKSGSAEPRSPGSESESGADAQDREEQRIMDAIADGHADGRGPFALEHELRGVDAALRHLAILNELKRAGKALSRTITRVVDDNGDGPGGGAAAGGVTVEVDVTSAWVPSMPVADMIAARQFPFAYRVRVTNAASSTQDVQLVGRHWRFEGADGSLVVVPRGSTGVVGRSPYLRPGQAFEYTSGELSPHASQQHRRAHAARLPACFLHCQHAAIAAARFAAPRMPALAAASPQGRT